MMRPAILPRVAALIEDQTGTDAGEIRADTSFAELGMDSLDRIDLGMALELEFGITLPARTEATWQTVGEAVAWLEVAGAKA